MEINVKWRIHKKAIIHTICWLILICFLGTTEYVLADTKSPLLIIRIKGNNFEESARGLTLELENNFSISEMIITKSSMPSDIEKKINAISPKIIVLMDNMSIALYKKYRSSIGNSKSPIPTVSAMSAFVDLAIQGLENANGIYYEVPIMTSVVSLRSVLNVPLEKIGVVHREFIHEFITSSKEFCKKEGIELISYEIQKNDNLKKKLEESLKKLLAFFEEKTLIYEIVEKCIKEPTVKIFIGSEITDSNSDLSLVTKPYKRDDKIIGTLGVIGPKRMRYPEIIPIVDYTAEIISKLLSEIGGIDE